MLSRRWKQFVLLRRQIVLSHAMRRTKIQLQNDRKLGTLQASYVVTFLCMLIATV